MNLWRLDCGAQTVLVGGNENLAEDLNKRKSPSSSQTHQIEFQDLVSGADANEGFVDTFEKASKALQKIEHDMAIKIPDSTQVAINKFEQSIWINQRL